MNKETAVSDEGNNVYIILKVIFYDLKYYLIMSDYNISIRRILDGVFKNVVLCN